jgi:hypothetical protein
MSEWLKVPLSKSGVPARVPGVRIPLSPPIYNIRIFVKKSSDFNQKAPQEEVGGVEREGFGKRWFPKPFPFVFNQSTFFYLWHFV